MKIFIIFLIFSTNLFSKITFEEIDLIRSYTDVNAKSIIQNGTNFCNDYFERNFSSSELNYQNSFTCKFSKKRNRFYVYMLSVDKRNDLPIKKFCMKTLESWPEILDHTDKQLNFHNKKFLEGFFIDNFFNGKIISFTKNFIEDQNIIQNEINNYIIKNRKNFSNDNKSNNLLVENELNKIKKIYKKVVANTVTDLDRIIETQLNKIVRYKIFVNDVRQFQSFSCNWRPGKGIEPYVKREKFSEFENI